MIANGLTTVKIMLSGHAQVAKRYQRILDFIKKYFKEGEEMARTSQWKAFKETQELELSEMRANLTRANIKEEAAIDAKAKLIEDMDKFAEKSELEKFIKKDGDGK